MPKLKKSRTISRTRKTNISKKINNKKTLKSKKDPEYIINSFEQISKYVEDLKKYLDDTTISERIKKFSLRRLLSADLYGSNAPLYMSSLITYKLLYSWENPLATVEDDKIIPEFKSLLQDLHIHINSNKSKFNFARLIIHTTDEDNIYNNEYMAFKYNKDQNIN